MRLSTSLVAVAVAGGTLSLALQAAEQGQVPELPLSEAAPGTAEATPTGSESPAPTNSTPSSSPSPTSSGANQQTNSPTQTAKPTQTATPTQTAPVVKTVKSDAINYKYGVVQVELTAKDGKITNVVLLQGDASYGRDAAYTALIDATIQVQGTNYGNVSGATFTTDAFKKAVENAISKL